MSWPSSCQTVGQRSVRQSAFQTLGVFSALRGKAVSSWVVPIVSDSLSHLHYPFFKANQFYVQCRDFTSTRYNLPLFWFHFILGNHLCAVHRFLSCRKMKGLWMPENSCPGFAPWCQPPRAGPAGAWVSCSSRIALLKLSLTWLDCNYFCLQKAVPHRYVALYWREIKGILYFKKNDGFLSHVFSLSIEFLVIRRTQNCVLTSE